MSDTENSENSENSEITENKQILANETEILKKPKRKINISESEINRRVERLENARLRKKELKTIEDEKVKLYLKQKEEEIYNNVMKKLNKKEKEQEKKVIKKLIKPIHLDSDEEESSEDEIIQKPIKSKSKKKTVTFPSAPPAQAQYYTNQQIQPNFRFKVCD